MTTDKQLEVNRLNAQQSTGPRSDEGKAVSRFNALKHGIDARSLVIPGEDPIEFATLIADYFNRFEPAGPVEAFLVRTAAVSDWLVRRYDRIEAAVVRSLIGDRDPEIAIPELYSRPAGKSNPLPHLFRRRCAAQRDAMQALKELQRLQKERRSAEATEEAAAAPAQNGFDSKQQPARIQPVSQVPHPASKLAS